MRRRDPFEQFENFFEQFSNNMSLPQSLFEFNRTSFSVSYDEEDDEVVVTGDLPGYSEDELELEIRQNTLFITAKKETEEDGNHYSTQSFSHQLPLKKEIDPEGATASLKNGVLTVRLPVADHNSHIIDFED